MRRTWVSSLLFALLLAPITSAGAASGERYVGTDRPALVVFPSESPAAPQPLLIVLHGYTSSGEYMDRYLRLRPAAAQRGVVLAFPNGTKEEGTGTPFWQGTDACCNFRKSAVDDVAYIVGLIDVIAAETPIDRRRIYVFGHSNGSFMGYRLACTRSEVFAAVAGLAGATFADKRACTPSVPISVLHMHGTADETVPISGTYFAAPVPSALQTLRMWAEYDRCNATKGMRRGPDLDLARTLSGRETRTYSYACAKGINVDFWKILGGRHSPSPGPSFAPLLLDWLLKHQR